MQVLTQISFEGSLESWMGALYSVCMQQVLPDDKASLQQAIIQQTQRIAIFWRYLVCNSCQAGAKLGKPMTSQTCNHEG